MAVELEQEELRQMETEAQWILKEEVHSVLEEVEGVLLECCRRFTLKIGSNNLVKPDKFILSSPTGSPNMKCVITLMGDSICEADLQVKVHRHQTQIFKTGIQPDEPWKLQQIQDAGNHLAEALHTVKEHGREHQFKSGEEVTILLDSIMKSLNTGRTCLVLPKKKTLDELLNNRNMHCFKPPLPSEVSVSFYVHAQKLEMAVYQLQHGQPGQKVEIVSRYQGECQVPWLNDVIVLFTLALQSCQQLKDKISIIEEYSKSSKGH
ncbi:protein rogdi isoform X2 [Lingula anatina]|uniref:Protein rogdi isoform X2 n=1 Tax=Lingula anatina TaxID=7574 RepID=A0A1S3KE72_LINAN|nr:protein rogdi isoform X2 [Lingula anatina]|eukprot:XP_013420754.1 protein rogdi isoform X2 [Lingula anatina]